MVDCDAKEILVGILVVKIEATVENQVAQNIVVVVVDAIDNIVEIAVENVADVDDEVEEVGDDDGADQEEEEEEHVVVVEHSFVAAVVEC